MLRVTLNFDLSKIPFVARVKTYTHTKNLTCTFTGSHPRVVTDANNAGRHSTTTRATYCQLLFGHWFTFLWIVITL